MQIVLDVPCKNGRSIARCGKSRITCAGALRSDGGAAAALADAASTAAAFASRESVLDSSPWTQ